MLYRKRRHIAPSAYSAFLIRDLVFKLSSMRAGFTRSNLVDVLCGRVNQVIAPRHLATNRREFLKEASLCGRSYAVDADVHDVEAVVPPMQGCDSGFHPAANADARMSAMVSV